MNPWQEILENLAIVALLVSTWAAFHPRVETVLPLARSTIFGFWMGCSVIISIALSVEIQPGILLDFRSAVVAMSGLFGGPVSAAITCLIGGAYRLWLGGAGTQIGLLNLAGAGVISSTAFLLSKGKKTEFWHVVTMAFGMAALSIGISYIAFPSKSGIDTNISGVPLFLLNFLATLLSGYAILKIREFTEERDLLRAALAQSPDFYYIKDRQGRFKIVNQAVATHNGRNTPRDMVGLTDFDITSNERASQLFQEEQAVMSSQRGLRDKEEAVETAVGLRWFKTSKEPLIDREGNIIGLAGVTHDITRAKEMELELAASHDVLKQAMEQMSDGLAMFDRAGRLMFCNEQYQAFFPQTADVRIPGNYLSEMIAASALRGEFSGTNVDSASEWIDQTMALYTSDFEREVRTSRGSWLILRNRKTLDGGSLVVVADITSIKQSEAALRQLNEQLKQLAETDGLTGLANRRSFDVALESNIQSARETDRPLAFLMIDVDRFKAYNDLYGHAGGDDCLRAFADCLTDTRSRTDDLVARFGGEEFAVLLPDTDGAGAFAFASRFREKLKGKALPHHGSEKGRLTASIGISVLVGRERQISSKSMINRADEALYQAKASGRDCVRTWAKLATEASS